MYANDLIIITKPSRATTCSINSCLSIYAHLTGQCQNPNKSKVFFPTWYNVRMASSISNIIKFKIGKILFLYLCVLISYKKKLSVAHFKTLINKMNSAVRIWQKARISRAGKAILINSSLMDLPTY